MAAVGRIHSIQSLGAVDGPGLRCTLFLQGCPLRCAYCHNPDTWDFTVGVKYTPEQAAAKALRFRPYFGKKGGVTATGGEPLAQPEFVTELFSLLRREGVHTALDTSGICDLSRAEEVLRCTDLVLADLKFLTAEDYRAYCGADFERVLDFLALTERMSVPLWIRHVVVPGLTDGEQHIRRVAQAARRYSNLQKIELLPFRKLCLEKYRALDIPFPLESTPEMGEEALERLRQLIK